MYFEDHAPPHFPALCAGDEAKIEISSGRYPFGHLNERRPHLQTHAHIIFAESIGDHCLRLRFYDGVEKEVNVRPILGGPVFEPLKDASYFHRFKLDTHAGTVVWPNGADFAPEAPWDLPDLANAWRNGYPWRSQASVPTRMISVQEILERLVRIESLSSHEAAAADQLTGILETGGLTVHRVDDSVWCSIGSGSDGLLLNSHLDVVPASEGHPYPPFTPTVVDGALYGRGAVDAKGCVSAMSAAMLSLAADGWEPQGGRLIGAFTTCEETGWPYNGLQQTRPNLPSFRAAIVGEPTDLKPCIAQKGLLILRLECKGRSAHAARPHLGENAVIKAAADIQRLVETRLERVHPELGPVTVTPTVIQGGKIRNMIPDLCTVQVDVRSTPSYTHAELVAILQEAVEGEIVIHSDRLISVDTAPDERIVAAGIDASGASPFGSPTASDWIFLSDIPTIKMGPGSSDLSHTANEHIRLDELNRAVEVYRQTILGYFSRS